MKNKIKKYSKVAAVATLVPVSLSVGFSSQTDVAFAATPEVKVASAQKTMPLTAQLQNQQKTKASQVGLDNKINLSRVTEKAKKKSAPTLNPLQPYAQTFDGKGIPGYTVHLSRKRFQEAFVEIATAKVDNAGNWSITATDFYAEEWAEYQVVQEKNGTYSYRSESVVPRDTIAPEVPYINGSVYDNTTSISGGSNEFGEIIVKFPNGTEIKEHGFSKTWSILVPNDVKLKAGDVIVFQFSDNAGNRSAETRVTVLSSATTPELPLVNKIVTDQTTISGRAVAGNTVKVTFDNGQVAETKVDTAGKWAVNVPNGLKLKSTNRVSVTQINPQGIKSGVTVVQVQPGEVAAPTMNSFVEGTTKITGTGIPGAEAVVYYDITWPNSKSSRAIIDENGNWSVDVDPTYMIFGRRVNAIQIYDTALSTSTSFNVAAAARIPNVTINQYYAGDKVITGKGIEGSTVTVTLPNGKTLTTKVDAAGNWSASVPAGSELTEGKKIKATQTSISGATSELIRIYVWKR